MTQTIPDTMQAAAIDQFGGVEALTLRTMPVPKPGPDELLLRIEAAGLGAWDREEREGKYADYLGATKFPYVLGWDAAGTVAAVGERVSRFQEGDVVYAASFPKRSGGGFYAEYAAVNADDVALVPETLTIEQAGVMGWDALTALAGLDETLGVEPGETLMVFGASGGIGHLAVQLAKRLGARVFAVASGADGVALVQRLGADGVVDGRNEDVVAAARAFAPAGLDTALVTAGGAEHALGAIREGGRVAYPNGVTPKPQPRAGIRLANYDAVRGSDATAKLHRLIASGPFDVHIGGTFPLNRVADAHRALAQHYLGKLALRPLNAESSRASSTRSTRR